MSSSFFQSIETSPCEMKRNSYFSHSLLTAGLGYRLLLVALLIALLWLAVGWVLW